MEMVKTPQLYFLFSACNNLLTYSNLHVAGLNLTGEYLLLIVIVWTLLYSVCTALTSGHYSPVQPSCSVWKGLTLVLYCMH